MRRLDDVQRFFLAFAALIALAPSRASHMDTYKKWIQRLGVNEYADELIVAAVASELGVRIVCVPYTPADARSRWAISTYYSAIVGGREQNRTIYFGNNDVHYVLLSPN